MNEKMLTTEQVADQLSVKVETVRDWLRRGLLVGYKIGGAKDWRVKPSDLNAFLEKRRNIREEQ